MSRGRQISAHAVRKTRNCLILRRFSPRLETSPACRRRALSRCRGLKDLSRGLSFQVLNRRAACLGLPSRDLKTGRPTSQRCLEMRLAWHYASLCRLLRACTVSRGTLDRSTRRRHIAALRRPVGARHSESTKRSDKTSSHFETLKSRPKHPHAICVPT
jgi:hypothetical protein